MRKAAIEDDVDKLYQLPLDQFTAARNLLAKQAGGAGDDIRALQKPPLAAWAVNQVFWKNRPVYDTLVKAALALRAAHRSVLSGKRADLRAVGQEHEEALEAALKTALKELAETGHPATDTTRQAIATTLRGLPAEEPPGRLARTLQPGGFEMLSSIPLRPADVSKAAAPKRASRTPHRKKSEADTKARAMKMAEHNASREEFEAARAARDVDKAARDVKAAREQIEEAQRVLDEADRAAAAAERKRETAQRRAQEAEAALSKAQARVREAERDLETRVKADSR
jgi:hypothetical protein